MSLARAQPLFTLLLNNAGTAALPHKCTVLTRSAPQIMSLIDTIALGRMADALQLAALGPSSLLLTFSNYILFGLSVGTVSLIAERLKDRDVPSAAIALSSSLFLAAAGGACMGAVFLCWGPQLLRMTGAEAAVLPPAAQYLRIRALALPAVILSQVAQAGLLAQRDSLSPFRVVLATSCVSLAGDLLLIGQLGMGVAGAAWTTILAQASWRRRAEPCLRAQTVTSSACSLSQLRPQSAAAAWCSTLDSGCCCGPCDAARWCPRRGCRQPGSCTPWWTPSEC